MGYKIHSYYQISFEYLSFSIVSKTIKKYFLVMIIRNHGCLNLLIKVILEILHL